MVHSPHRRLQIGGHYRFYLQSLNMTTPGIITAVRAVTNAYVQLVVNMDGGRVESYLNVPITDDAPPVRSPETVCLVW